MNHHPWPMQQIEPLGITVGPWAWGAPALLGTHLEEIREKPSLVVIDAEHLDEKQVASVASVLAKLRNTSKANYSTDDAPWPLMLCLPQPRFARRLPDVVARLMGAMSIPRLDVLTLHVDDAQDLKSGGVLQGAFKLRDEGVVRNVGLASDDVRSVEWMALHTAVRLLMFPYNLADQAGRYRLLQAADDSAMACVTQVPVDAPIDTIRFALGQAHRVLPILDRPPPPGIGPMTPNELDHHWQAYCQSHEEPAALPRGLPPEA